MTTYLSQDRSNFLFEIVGFFHEHAANPAKIDRWEEILQVNIQDISFLRVRFRIRNNTALAHKSVHWGLRRIYCPQHLIEFPLNDLEGGNRGRNLTNSPRFFGNRENFVMLIWGTNVEVIDQPRLIYLEKGRDFFASLQSEEPRAQFVFARGQFQAHGFRLWRTAGEQKIADTRRVISAFRNKINMKRRNDTVNNATSSCAKS
jgi:hypothetical protein